jgi:uncharacterized membrane protein
MSARRLEAGLAVIAFLIAGYLTYERHQGQNALCPVGGGGCETVAHSSYSKFVGVPVSYFGMLGAITLFVLLRAFSSGSRHCRRSRPGLRPF